MHILVAQVVSNWNLILTELSRWKEFSFVGTGANQLYSHKLRE